MLQALADIFALQTGKELTEYTFVFPNHRAGLFFRKCLAQAVKEPVFSPKIISINECFSALTNLQTVDDLHLLMRLYALYQQLRKDAEPLEDFLYWGKMMLSDFSEVDHHLVKNVQQLFTAVKDLKTIDSRFEGLSEAQLQAIRQFWGEYLTSVSKHPDSSLHTHFLSTWELLWPLYDGLRSELLTEGLAYDGMLHRQVIEHFDEIDPKRLDSHYVFVGFNALTESERQLMLLLKKAGKADFYFDYSHPWLQDPDNKASLFYKENTQLFPSRFTPTSHHPQKQQVHLIKVPTTLSEVHESYDILTHLLRENTANDLTKTAVVLPDEDMLIPLLHCLPPEADKVNVTMGYPLKATSLYATIAYPEKIWQELPPAGLEFIAGMRNQILHMQTEENAEGIYLTVKVLEQIEKTLQAFPQVKCSGKAAWQILKMLTLETGIPYAGEPLNGLQIMGVLETRALEFDNLIILGFNDDLYPGKNHQNSFIPYILRRGFGLPTIERQDAIFAYNFYRMLSYAKNVWLIANTTADDIHTGELSRYYYQLTMQHHLPIEEEVLHLPSSVTMRERLPIEKTAAVMTELQKYAQYGIAPSALNQYIHCPKQFYWEHIAHITPPKPDETVSVSDLTLGSVFHDLVKQLYKKHKGHIINREHIAEMMQRVENEWNQWNVNERLQGDILAEKVVRTYLDTLLQYDMNQVPFTYLENEQEYELKWDIPGMGKIRLFGYIDRIDEQNEVTRIIDYKTGKAEMKFENVDDIFNNKKSNSAIMQTMFYCMLYNHKHDKAQCVPHIYALRQMGQTQPLETQVRCTKQETGTWDAIMDAYKQKLQTLLEEIFDSTIPFEPLGQQTDKTCLHCAFNSLCLQAVPSPTNREIPPQSNPT